MSLDGGLEEVDESFFSRAFSVCSLPNTRLPIERSSLAAARIAASINPATSCCVNRLGILLSLTDADQEAQYHFRRVRRERYRTSDLCSAKFGFLTDLLGHQAGIGLHRIGQPIALFGLRRLDRRLDVVNQRIDMAGRGGTFQSRLHGSATLVTQDHDQSRAKVVDGIFNAPQAMVVDQVAGRSDHKQVADVLVENQFLCGSASRHNRR